MSFLFPLLAYLLGSIPFGVLVARSCGVDITKAGSGNIGATNVARAVGKKEGLLVLLLDGSKGCLSVLLPYLFGQTEVIVALSAVAVLIGNIVSIFFHFRGGKGIATGTGVLLGLSWKVFLLTLLIWFATAATTGFISLASLLGFLSLPFLFFYVAKSLPLALVGTLFFLLALYRHKANIQRLLKGEEPRTFHDFFKKRKPSKEE